MELLLVTLIVLAPLFILFSISAIVTKRGHLRSRLPFDYTQLARIPAFSLMSKHKDLSLDFLLYGLIASIFFQLPFSTPTIISFFNLSDTLPSWWSYSAIYLLGCFYCIFKAVRAFTEMRNIRLGIEAEWAVASILAQIEDQQVRIFHDIQGTNFNLDHVLTYPGGVVAIETKGRRKPNGADKKNSHKLTVDGENLIFPHFIDNETVPQAVRQARWLSGNLSSSTGLDISVNPIVAIPGWFINLKNRPAVPVVNHKNLKKYYRQSNRIIFSDSDLSRINHQLELLSKRMTDDF